MAEQAKIALFIDADNVSPKIIPAIMDELTGTYGEVTYRRAYRNWAIPNADWQDIVARYSMQPIYQASNVRGKNSADIKLIIDAMDALYAGAADTFCIVSSDSDFTALVIRLRESGKDVIGIGMHDTVKDDSALARACSKFIFIENLVGDGEQASGKGDFAEADRDGIERAVSDLVLANADADGKMNISQLKDALVNQRPDFDERSFGFSAFSKFLNSFRRFELIPPEAPMFVALTDSKSRTEQVFTLIQEFVAAAGKRGHTLPEIGAEINERYPGQSIRALGYTRMDKLLADVEGISVRVRPDGEKIAVSAK